MDDSNRPPSGIFEMGMPRQFRDTGFRGVLAHRVAMIALLRLRFTDEQLAGLDLQALRQEPTRTSGPLLRQAEHDLIWSAPVTVPDEDGPRRVYFLIEVQSTVEATMPLRMLMYAALLGMRLDSEYKRPLPPMVPIVLYTEEPRWRASDDSGEMFGVWFAESVPRMRHYVLDLCRVEAGPRSGNVMALLALVLQGASEEALFAGAEALYRRLVELGDQPMENSFFELVRGLCDNKWPGQNWEDCSNMAELVSALEEHTITWPEKWRANYIAEGRTEGLAEGVAKGRAEGLAEGVAKGRVGLLVSMARQRFGEAVASTMSVLLGSVRTESALEEVGTWLLTCETGDALIAKIRQR